MQLNPLVDQPRRCCAGGQFRKAVIVICTLAAAVIACSGPGRSADLPEVSVAALAKVATIWPLLVAEDRGFFAEAGIKLDLIISGASTRSAQQAAAGSVNIGNTSVFDAFRAIDGGAELTIFLNSQQDATSMLIGAKSIKSISDLKGKRVITGGPKDITNLWWEAMARHFGVDPEKDVDLVFSGASPGRFAALTSGAVEAAVLSAPLVFAAMSQGYTNLGVVGPYLGEVPSNVWCVNNNWAKGHQKEVLAFAVANNRAAQFILDHNNRETAAKILATTTSISMEEALQTYDLNVDQAHAIVADGSISIAGLEKARAILIDSGDLKTQLKPISAFYDDHIVVAARKLAN
jgi:NitT/TauT family transport system substrate-binding protein